MHFVSDSDSAEDQLCYVLAIPHNNLACMSVMDLFELGGELTAIRRRGLRASKSKRAENKERDLEIEATTEAKWKKRL